MIYLYFKPYIHEQFLLDKLTCQFSFISFECARNALPSCRVPTKYWSQSYVKLKTKWRPRKQEIKKGLLYVG